jgi:steroid 5-alpha reductase family enzyme
MILELSPTFIIMLKALPAVFLIAGCTWMISLYLDKISIIYYSWPILFLVASLVYLVDAETFSEVQIALILMVSIWSVRLNYFAIKRGRHQPEDRRYQVLRERSSSNFILKSFYLILFWQPILAWAGSSIFAIVMVNNAPWSLGNSIGVALWCFGIIFETVADNQLYRFNRLVIKKEQTLKTGLWRYCRHPNYFGECCVWWAWFLFAIPSGNGFILLAPLLITGLLLKVSGIRLMEKGITQRRADYGHYMQSTNTLFPWVPREQVNGELYEKGSLG